MIATFERRLYEGREKLWAGRYHNLSNLPHWHIECELIHLEAGEITVSHNHQEYTLHPGESIFLGSGDIHYIKTEHESIVSIIMFDSKLIRELTDTANLISPKLHYSYPIPAYCTEIRKELHDHPLFFELKSCEMIISLMIDIFRKEALTDAPAKKVSSIMNYKSLLDEVEKKYSSITFADAAAFMGLSQPYFSKFFKKLSGMTFSQYLNYVKLEHAIDMMKNNAQISITEVAMSCGFETIRHFNRIFKEATGMSPRQLPNDYILDIHPIRRLQDAFDPTLQSSELI